MKLITALSVITALVTQAAHALPPDWLRVRKIEIHSARDGVHTGFVSPHRAAAEETGHFDQLIDHFPVKDALPTSADYFKQRFFIDASLAKGKDSPVIYYICGEGTCDGASRTPLVNQLAEELGAYRVALEHRYYGTSQPFSDLSTAHLRYLSVEQALEDLAVFQRHVQETRGLTGKWIAVGGSYPGNLAAFYRLKHPELVAGALASSAPVLSKADFEEYDLHVAKVTQGECLKAIQTTVADVEKRMETADGKASVKALFHASDVLDDEDFLYNLADMAAIAIQYGYQDQFCSALVKGVAEGRLTEAYAEIGVKLFADFGMTPYQDAFASAISENPADYLGWAGLRPWMYQSCTQFGFYQTAYRDPAMSSRSSRVNLDYHNRTCDRLFGIKKQVDTEKTNRDFYEPLFSSSTTHIFFTNGSNDPWSNLSITDHTPGAHRGMNLFVIAGAAHCDDLGRRVSASLTEARTRFKTLVGEWLK